MFRWAGGKRQEIKKFQHWFPSEYKTYVEPFIGAGAVYFHLNHDGANVIADVDDRLINFFELIKQGKGSEIKALVDAMPNTKEDYLKIRDGYEPETDVEKAAKFFYLRQTCFRSIDYWDKNGRWRTPWNTSPRAKVSNTATMVCEDRYRLFQRTTVLKGSFEDTIRRYDSPDTFMFLDPPYDTKDYYGSRSFGVEQHRKLRASLENCSCKWLMIVHDTPLMRDLYGDKIRESYSKTYNMKKVKTAPQVTHLLITNYTL
jgi:DNA adenine methylase